MLPVPRSRLQSQPRGGLPFAGGHRRGVQSLDIMRLCHTVRGSAPLHPGLSTGAVKRAENLGAPFSRCSGSWRFPVLIRSAVYLADARGTLRRVVAGKLVFTNLVVPGK